MATETEPLWSREFGAEYAVPRSLGESELWEDCSWSNDACPRFLSRFEVTRGELRVRGRLEVWAEHPDIGERSDYFRDYAGRFTVFFVERGEEHSEGVCLFSCESARLFGREV